MSKNFTPDWKEWIATNVNAGQDRDGIFKILLDNGFAHADIVTEMNYQPAKPTAELINPLAAEEAKKMQRLKAAQQQQLQQQMLQRQRQLQQEALINNDGTAIPKDKIITPNAVAVNSDNVDMRVIENFLTPQECKKIIHRIKANLRPSELSNARVDNSFRNSRTCHLGYLNDNFIKKIDTKICQLLGIHPAYTETLQGQYYEVGQEFKAHTDFFDKREVATHCQELGQRTYTVMIYLDDVTAGGETHFVNIDTAFAPVMGTAVIWNNLNPDGTPNEYTRHCAKPVLEGHKTIITKWFRSRAARGSQHLTMFS